MLIIFLFRYWNSIEDYCRRLSKKYSQVNVISGPLFLPLVDLKSKKKFVKYEVSKVDQSDILLCLQDPLFCMCLCLRPVFNTQYSVGDRRE